MPRSGVQKLPPGLRGRRHGGAPPAPLNPLVSLEGSHPSGRGRSREAGREEDAKRFYWAARRGRGARQLEGGPPAQRPDRRVPPLSSEAHAARPATFRPVPKLPGLWSRSAGGEIRTFPFFATHQCRGLQGVGKTRGSASSIHLYPAPADVDSVGSCYSYKN